MSFLTEYFDEYRQHPIRKTQPCKEEDRFAKFEGKWLDPRKGKQDKEMTEEETKELIKETMRSLRGESIYYSNYCAQHPPEMKTRPHVPRKTYPAYCKRGGGGASKEEEEAVGVSNLPKLALKDTEVMKTAHDIYERDMDEPTLEPLQTHFRVMGYCRPQLFKTGISEYQGGIGRLAYELVRDDRIPRYTASNGGRPKWGYPPDGVRQPMLDGAPFDGERLYD